MIRTVLVEDRKDYARVLMDVFASHDRICLVKHFGNPLQFFSRMDDMEFDVVLLDVEMPNVNGIECIESIKRSRPESKIIMLTVHDDDFTITRAFKSGADGYLLKNSEIDVIANGIESVVKGQFPMSGVVAKFMIDVISDSIPRKPGISRLKQIISEREYQVLESLAEGNTYAKVADALGISPDTVKTHTHRIYEKLGVSNKTQAVALFLKDQAEH